jgi:hypothetical protein
VDRRTLVFWALAIMLPFNSAGCARRADVDQSADRRIRHLLDLVVEPGSSAPRHRKICHVDARPDGVRYSQAFTVPGGGRGKDSFVSRAGELWRAQVRESRPGAAESPFFVSVSDEQIEMQVSTDSDSSFITVRGFTLGCGPDDVG